MTTADARPEEPGAATAVQDPRRPTLALYKDDGPLARAIGALLRPIGRKMPHSLLVVAAAAPMLVLMAAKGAAADHAVAGIAIAWLVLVAGTTGGQEPTDRLRWAVPPVIRLAEYAGLLWIGAMGGESSEPAAFTLICVLAFRHYDVVYRLRHQGVAPPAWVGDLALGWDGRLVLGYILLVAQALPAGFFIAAGLLATVFVAESIAGWRRFGRAPQSVTYEDEEDEGQ
jgi:hypothetical protein